MDNFIEIPKLKIYFQLNVSKNINKCVISIIQSKLDESLNFNHFEKLSIIKLCNLLIYKVFYYERFQNFLPYLNRFFLF